MNRREVLTSLFAAAFCPKRVGAGFAEAQQGNPPFDPTTPRPLRSPTLREFRTIADNYGLELTDKELNVYLEHMKPKLASLRKLEQMAEPTLPVKYPRTPGYRPKREENQLNAWFWKCSIEWIETIASKLASSKSDGSVASPAVKLAVGCASALRRI